MDLLDFLQLPFEEGLMDFIRRYPTLADTAEELRQRYSRENVFGLIRSFSLVLTKKIQDRITQAMEEGLPTKDVLEFIRKKIKDDTQIYADVVWRTNLNTAYNAGRQREAQRNPGFIVGFEFSATKDPDVRKNHLIVDSLRAPMEHEVWDFFTPPLGYNCRCVIRHITISEAARKQWLDKNDKLIPWHPKLGTKVSVANLMAIGAKPDYPEFGRRAR